MSIRLLLTVMLLSLILLFQLGTLSFPMTFLLIETALVKANPCGRIILMIKEWLRGYY
jgi:hypothetical protein